MTNSRTLAAYMALAFLGAFHANPSHAQVFECCSIGKAIEGWDGSFAAGINGSAGNSEMFNGNGVLNASKETDDAITTAQASYFYSRNRAGATTDRFYALGRRDIKMNDPGWMSLFYQGWYERDRFRNFDYRVAVHAGIGILLLQDDLRFHKARVGAGASREFGGPNDEWLPELLLGYDCRRQLTESTAIFANVDYFPNFGDFSDFRLNTLAGAEFMLDPALDLSLRFSIYNRYDSTPVVGNKANDIDYVMALAIGF